MFSEVADAGECCNGQCNCILHPFSQTCIENVNVQIEGVKETSLHKVQLAAPVTQHLFVCQVSLSFSVCIFFISKSRFQRQQFMVYCWPCHSFCTSATAAAAAAAGPQCAKCAPPTIYVRHRRRRHCATCSTLFTVAGMTSVLVVPH